MTITRWFNALRLSSKIAMMAGCALIALSIATFVSTTMLLNASTYEQGRNRQEVNMRVAWATLGELGSRFRVEGDDLYVGNVRLNGNLALVDKIKTLVGGSATIRGSRPTSSRATGHARSGRRWHPGRPMMR